MTQLVRLAILFRAYWAWMALAALLALATVLAGVALMAVSGWFIAAMGLAGVAGAAINYFTPAAVIRALAITRTGGRYAERIVGHEATLRLIAGLRSWLYERLMHVGPLGMPGLRSGDVLARMRGDIDRLEAVYLRLLVPGMVALLASLTVIAVLVLYDGRLALAAFVLLVLAGLVVPVASARAAMAPGERLAEGKARFNNLLVDSIEGLAELRAHGMAECQARRIATQSDRLIEDEARITRLAATSLSANILAAGLAVIATLALSAPAIASHRIGLADPAMLALLAFAAFEALAGVPLAVQSLPDTLAAARRIFALADAPAPVAEPIRPADMPRSSTLVFDGVGVTYAGALRPALQNTDLELAPGRRVAVIGHSGSGKSSLVNLALRFIDPAAGRITLGEVDVRELPSDEVRARMAVVEQNPHFFAASISDNLRLAQPDADDAELVEVCRIAQLGDFIAAQPHGLATFIGAQGQQISGGEARRLAVARALLKKAPLLILDEPTEGLDEATASAMLAAVLDARRNQGILLITHRRSALEQMHEIVVLDQGRVIARGNPCQVLRQIDRRTALDDAVDPESGGT